MPSVPLCWRGQHKLRGRLGFDDHSREAPVTQLDNACAIRNCSGCGGCTLSAPITPHKRATVRRSSGAPSPRMIQITSHSLIGVQIRSPHDALTLQPDRTVGRVIYWNFAPAIVVTAFQKNARCFATESSGI